MIAACPKCSARYRIEAGRLRPKGVRLRCSHCEAVFRVRPPTGEANAAPEPRPTDISTPAAAQSPVEPAAADRERRILVADPEIEQGKLTANTLVEWGLQPTLVHDGVEAILTIQRLLPKAIVIDAALPRMFGFQICEIVKRNESLRHIQVVLVGAIHNGSRYRRPPSEIYGADAYVERPQLPAGLLEGLSQKGPHRLRVADRHARRNRRRDRLEQVDAVGPGAERHRPDVAHIPVDRDEFLAS